MSNPTRFQSGVGTAYTGETFYDFPLPDPFHTGSTKTVGGTQYMQDFNFLGTSEYTVTGASSTFALTNAAGGAAILTPGGTTTASSAYKTAQIAQFQSGNRLWFTTRIKPSAVAGNVAFYSGLQNGSSVNDGIWFAKAAASTSINLVSIVGSTTTTLVSGVATAAAATYSELGFYYNGTDLLVYAGNNQVARVANVTIGSSATTLTDALLAPVVQITPTATDTLTVDFIGVAQELSR